MTISNTSFRITELDPASIKENLKQYLRSQNEFTDFDFEGSGIGVLLDILAYNAHYHAFYTNMIGNEAFLDTAQIRSSIISRAKELNYIPASIQGSQAKINVTVTPSDSEDRDRQTLTLDKYTKFLARDKDGVNYQFVTINSNTVSKSANSFVFSDIHLKQGEITTLQYLMETSNSKRRFTIPSSKVDTTTLKVSVQASTSNTSIQEYTLANDITELNGDSTVYWVEENEEGQYVLQFGDDIIGKKPQTGSVIIITYLESEGSIADKISYFYLSDSIGGEYNDNVNISVSNTSFGGSEKESMETIRFRAPIFYTTQNRAVTTNDYEILLKKDYNNIDSVSIWGGEDNDPVVYGKVFMSLKTRGNYQLTNVEKERIKAELIRNRNVVAITPEIVDPEYVYLLVKGSINYNPALTDKTNSELLTLVRAAISDYNSDELNTFGSTFRKSKLQQYIEQADKSILGSDISVYVQKRILMESASAKNFTLEYNLPLKKGDYVNKLFTSPTIRTLDYNGISREVYFEEKPFSETGIDGITILNEGKNYFSAPDVTITGDGSGATAVAKVRSGKIYAIEVTNRGSNYTRADITIGGSGTGAKAEPRLEAKFGTIRSFYYKNTGDKVILNENAGTVNYETGKLTITSFISRGTSFDSYYGDDTITFNFPISKEIILPLRNRILTIDEDDPSSIQLNMISEG